MVITLQRNMCDDSPRNLLIDFNSPLQCRLDKALIPPVNRNNIIIGDEPADADNNPFDFVDHQTNLNVRMLNDPFELAYYLSDANDKESEEKKNIAESELAEEVKLQDSITGFNSRNVSAVEQNSLILIEDVTDPFTEVSVSFSDISPQKLSSHSENEIESVFKKQREEESAFNRNLKTEVSLTEASDEAIKAIVANRVNACIQNALHQSRLHCDNNTSYLHNSLHSTDVVSTCLNVRKDPVLNSNWSTPQRHVSYAGELNKAFCSPSRYSHSFARQENVDNSVYEITLPHYKMLELRRNNSCFGALWSSDSHCEDLLTNRGSSELLHRNEKLQEKGDDPVFLEANNVAFMFTSFTQSSSEGEEDILSCKPQWEKSVLKLPKFDSEENDAELVAGIRDCRLLSSHKLINNEADIVLPIVLPMVEKTEGNMRIKSKQMQQTGKRGPIKAIVPLGNMVRKVSTSNGNKDDNGSSQFTSKQQPEMSRSRKFMESKSNTVNEKRSSSAGIPLVTPTVSLKNKESYFGRDSLQVTTPLQTEHMNKSSEFSLCGLVATSTPARKIPCRNLMKTMPSPILGKEKESQPLEMTKTKKREIVSKNRSFDEDQCQVKNKGLPNRIHIRSKSASYANSKQLAQPQKEKCYNYGKKICIPADKSSSCTRTRPEVRNAQSSILKPLKLNGQPVPSKQDHLLLDKKKSTLQLFPRLKKNSLLEIDKENVKLL